MVGKTHGLLVVSTHLKNMLVKWDHFPKDKGENKKTYLKPPPRWDSNAALPRRRLATFEDRLFLAVEWMFLDHRIIYLVTLMVDFYGKFVGKFSSYTEFMGNNYVHLLDVCQIGFGKYTMVSSNLEWDSWTTSFRKSHGSSTA